MSILKYKLSIPIALIMAFFSVSVFASAAAGGDAKSWDMTSSAVGYFSLAIFAFAYLLVMAEEFTHLRKSKPVIIAAGVIWGAIAWVAGQHGMSVEAEVAVRHNLLEYAELMLFLLVAMTYVNSMEERQVFDSLRAWLVKSGFGFRALFWITGILSTIADSTPTVTLAVVAPHWLYIISDAMPR